MSAEQPALIRKAHLNARDPQPEIGNLNSK